MISFLLKKLILFYKFFKIDTPLFILLILLSSFGLLILYSSSGGSLNLVYRQMIHLGLATSVMLVIAQIPPIIMLRASPILMILGVFLLILVLFFGSSGGGAQRWLDLGFVRFQPSELMKIIVPITIAAILSEKTLPPRAFPVIISLNNDWSCGSSNSKTTRSWYLVIDWGLRSLCFILFRLQSNACEKHLA